MPEVPIQGDVNVTFASSPNADKALQPGAAIEKVGLDDNGAGRYRIRF